MDGADHTTEIEAAMEAVRSVEVENSVAMRRESVMASKLRNAMAAFVLETDLSTSETTKWFEAIDIKGLTPLIGYRLIVETNLVKYQMALELEAAISERKKRRQQQEAEELGRKKKIVEEELASLKKKQERDLAELKQKQEKELAEKQQIIEATFPGLQLKSVSNTSNEESSSSDQKPSTSATSPASASNASCSTFSFQTIETICNHCERHGHEMKDCWELNPELKRNSLKNLKKHQCNRCKRIGHHENSCFDTFPEKRAAFLKWKVGREAKAQK